MAKWTRKYIDSLPDSCFLLVLPGGEKEDGLTEPLSLRKFPIRDADGKIDKTHLDNALARIPQSNLAEALKTKATNKAEKLLEQWKKEHKSMKKSLGSMSYQDLKNTLQETLREKYGSKNKDGGYYYDYPYVQDIYETEFVVDYKGKYYIGDYILENEVLASIGPFYPAKRLGWAKNGSKPVKIGAASKVAVISATKEVVRG